MISDFLALRDLWPPHRRSDKAQAFWWYALAIEGRHKHQEHDITPAQMRQRAAEYARSDHGEYGPMSCLNWLREAWFEESG